MSDHDMDIANADGATVRADINSALVALVGLHNGASAPATTFAFQLWVDTSGTDVLKQRNAANSAWVTIYDIGLIIGQLGKVGNWTKSQTGAITVLSDGATVAVDFENSNNFSLTIAGNRTLGQPSNQVVGQHGSITVTQDGTGSRTLAYHGDYKWAGGTAGVLTTTASAKDRLDYYVSAANVVQLVLSLDVK